MSGIDPVIAGSSRERILVNPQSESSGDDAAATPRDRDEPELGEWSASSAGEPFGEWELPGMGTSAPGCGEVSAQSFCDEHGHIQYRAHLCGRRECPECWSTQWAGPRTVSVVSRLAAARYAEPDGLDRRAVHAVVSPPEGDVPNSIEAFYSGRTKANEIAKEHGIRGGVVVAHGYRILPEVKEEYNSGDRELPMWRWVRANDRHWQDQVYWSPHYHIVGLARDVEPGDTDKDDGWVFKNIRSLGRYEGLRDREAMEEMVGTIRYLLSHATYPSDENRQSVTWFGDLHGTNFSPEEELSSGSWSVIQRIAEEVTGHRLDDEEGTDEEAEECPEEGCGGTVHDIWGARDFLDSAAAGELEREERERVRAVYEWTLGDRHPPPGMKRPQTEEQAREIEEFLLDE